MSRMSRECVSTTLLSLPNEVLLLILHNVITEEEKEKEKEKEQEMALAEEFKSYSYYPLREQIIRLRTFRSTAGTCRLFADLSRSIFWSKITLSMDNLNSFLVALDNEPGRSTCIRRVKFMLSRKWVSPSAVQVSKSLISAILSRLPNILDEFRICCAGPSMGTVFYGAVAEMQVMHVQTLVVGYRPAQDLSEFFGRFRNITHLQLSISVLRDTPGNFSFQLTNIKLRSLLLYVQLPFSRTEDVQSFIEVARAAAAMLRPACTALNELALIFRYSDITLPSPDFLAVFRELNSIGSPTVSTLSIHSIKPIECDSNHNIAHTRNIDFTNAFAPFPSLKHFTVDNVDISSRALEKMTCWQLETLQVVLPIEEAAKLSVEETVQSIVSSLQLPQLTALRAVVIALRCDSIDIEDASWHDFYYQEDARRMMTPVQEACEERGIQYRIMRLERPC